MAEIIRKLREEHKNITRLLDVLEHELGVFDATKQPDYDVVVSIADYFTGFPDRCHHPKEDLIFQRLREIDPAAAASIGNLEAEHEKIATLARHFREAVHNVLREAEMPRSAFDAAVRHFIRDQREHLQMEEEDFFPHVLDVFTAEDWVEIDAKVSSQDDPLFTKQAAQEFELLRKNILHWEREDEAEGELFAG
jgi:hemerythrin-like domain-containing protein